MYIEIMMCRFPDINSFLFLYLFVCGYVWAYWLQVRVCEFWNIRKRKYAALKSTGCNLEIFTCVVLIWDNILSKSKQNFYFGRTRIKVVISGALEELEHTSDLYHVQIPKICSIKDSMKHFKDFNAHHLMKIK